MRIVNHNGEVTITVGRAIPRSFTTADRLEADVEMDLRSFDYGYAGALAADVDTLEPSS